MVCPSAERRTLRTSSAWRATDGGRRSLSFAFKAAKRIFAQKNLHVGCPSSFQDILFSHCPVWVILREIFEKILCG